MFLFKCDPRFPKAVTLGLVRHPALAQHFYAVIALMRAASTWKKFCSLIQSVFPRKGDQLELGIED